MKVSLTAGQALGLMIQAVGMTQAELARRSELSAKHINLLISGRVNLTPEVAVAVSDAIAAFLMALDTGRRLRDARARGLED